MRLHAASIGDLRMEIRLAGLLAKIPFKKKSEVKKKKRNVYGGWRDKWPIKRGRWDRL